MVQFANESQKKVYLFISEYLEEHGFSPYYKLVSEATGLSVMQVGRVVNKLIDRKMLQRISAKQGLVMPKSTQSEVISCSRIQLICQLAPQRKSTSVSSLASFIASAISS